MKLSEFVKSSERTLSKKLTVDNDIKINLLHSAVGVATEVGEIAECLNNKLPSEIDSVNLAEECADVIWYLAIPIRDFGIDIDKLNSLAPYKTSLAQLVVDASNFLDMLKKISFYNKLVDGFDVEHHVCTIYQHMITMAHEYTFDLELALSNNQDKLRARFPDKYDNEKALNRDLKTERKELEKGM